jgi:hypothetical protein
MMLLLHTALLATAAIAAPAAHWDSGADTNTGRGGYNGWDSSSKEASYADFGRRWHRGRDSQRGSCDLRNAVMPAGMFKHPLPQPFQGTPTNIPPAPIALPPPAAGLTLGHVAIGRGNQNYTCDLSNSTAVPVATGAVATLFNVSCLAADMPELLARICPIALDLPVPSSEDANSPIYQGMSGHHYFKDASTPFFDLDTSAHSYGNGAFKKGNSTAAPATAMMGPYNSGNGPVAWLRLDAKTTTDGQVFKEVYRLNTAGGQPPKTCQGMPAAFEVPYAAEYWLYQ